MNDADAQQDEVVELEERFWLEGGANPAFWRRHFDDRGLVVLPIGIIDKAQTVQAMEQAQPWGRVDMEDVRVVELADSVVLVTYEATASRPGAAGDYRAFIGSVYAHQPEGWHLIFHQQSPSPPSGPD